MAGSSNCPIIDLAHLMAPIDDLEVFTCVVKQLGITHGDQDKVSVTIAKKVRHDSFVSASVCLTRELEYHHFKIIKDYNPQQCPPDWLLFVVKIDSSEDVDKLSSHMMGFGAETVNFCRVLKFSEAI